MLNTLTKYFQLFDMIWYSYVTQDNFKRVSFYGWPSPFSFFFFSFNLSLLQKLPQFPLPTHDVVVRYWPPPEFEVSIFFFKQVCKMLTCIICLCDYLIFMLQRNTVAFDEDQPRELEKASVLQDAISDLPYVVSPNSTLCLIAFTALVQFYRSLIKIDIVGHKPWDPWGNGLW